MTLPPYDPNANYNAKPGDTQAMTLGPKTGMISYDPKNEPAIKKLNKILWLTAGAYALSSIAGIIDNISYAQNNVPESGLYAGTSATTLVMGGIVGLIIGLGLFFLVYALTVKGKKAGRITGTVFAALGILSALAGAFNIFGGSVWAILAGIFSLIWGVLAIIWIVKAYKPEVSKVLR